MCLGVSISTGPRRKTSDLLSLRGGGISNVWSRCRMGVVDTSTILAGGIQRCIRDLSCAT